MLAKNSHDLDCAIHDAVIDAVDTADTTSVPLTDAIDCLVLEWVLRELVEALEKRVEISISLRIAELMDAASVDPLQICLRVFVNPIVRHCAATLPLFRRVSLRGSSP